MNKKTRNVLIAVLILSGFVIAFVGFSEYGFSPIVVSGYDGITAQITEVNAPLYDATIRNDGENAQIDPEWKGGFSWDPTGVTIEIDSAVDVVKIIEEKDPIYEIVPGVDEDTKKEWQIKIYQCEIGVTIKTYGVGLDRVQDITYTIELYENDFSLFTDADENYAAMIEVYNAVPANRTQTGIMNVAPASGGAPYVLTPLGNKEIPGWLQEAADKYNVGNIAKLSKVSFDIHLIEAAPGTFLAWRAGEAQTNYKIAVDVYVAGYWEETVEHGWVPPVPDRPWYQFIYDIAGFIGGIIEGPLMFILFVVLTVGVVVVIIRVVRK